jgi:hypothetical protein
MPAVSTITRGQKAAYTRATLDSLIQNGGVGELIFVYVSGMQKFGGSLWTNSVATGRWHDFLVHDVVSYVDSAFRTLPVVESRGLMGYSMGGRGALTIGMRGPLRFGALYVFGLCCHSFVEPVTNIPPVIRDYWKDLIRRSTTQGLRAVTSWWDSAAVNWSAALSPNPGNAPFYSDFPFALEQDRLVQNEPGYSRWAGQSIFRLLEEFADSLRRIPAIHIDQSIEDDDPLHPAEATSRLSRALFERRIAHEFHFMQGPCGKVEQTCRWERSYLEAFAFFARTLRGAAPRRMR